MGKKVDLRAVLEAVLVEVRGCLEAMAQGPEWDRVQSVRVFVEDALSGVGAMEAEVGKATEKADELGAALMVANIEADAQKRRAEAAEEREEKHKAKILDLENAGVIGKGEKSKLEARVKELEDAAKAKKA